MSNGSRLKKYQMPQEWVTPWKAYGNTSAAKVIRSTDVKSNIEKEQLHHHHSEQAEGAEKKNKIMNYVSTAIAFIPFGGITTSILGALLPNAGAAIGFITKALGKTIEQYATTAVANSVIGFEPEEYLKEVKYNKDLKNSINTSVKEMGFEVPDLGEMFVTQFTSALKTEVLDAGVFEAGEGASKAEIISAQKDKFKDLFGTGEGAWKFNNQATDILTKTPDAFNLVSNMYSNDLAYQYTGKWAPSSTTTKLGQEYGWDIDIPDVQSQGFFNKGSISAGLSSDLSGDLFNPYGAAVHTLQDKQEDEL